MSADTWNFPTWHCRDRGTSVSPRASAGGGWSADGQVLPFTESMTGIFSFLADSSYTANGGELQTITSIGYQSAAGGPNVWVVFYSGVSARIEIVVYDNVAGTKRFHKAIGDEGGNYFTTDKWYQVAFSVNASRFQAAVNGVEGTPAYYTYTDVPGTLNISESGGYSYPRWWHGSPNAAYTSANPYFATTQWPSVLLGPSAWDSTALDLTDQTVLDRIYDSEGNFKNPGANGSLWFNDTYTTTAGFSPDVFMLDGGARFEQGSAGLTWTFLTGSSLGSSPGGLRKFYE